MAKPRRYTAAEVADHLEVKLLKERKTLADALREISLDRAQYARMVHEDPDFEHRVMVIRDLHLTLMEDELLEIADDKDLGFALRRDMIDTRKWILARRNERYRDKKDITTDGKPLLISDI